jgi:hypothetical protein
MRVALQVEVPVYPDGLPPEQRERKSAIKVSKLSIPLMDVAPRASAGRESALWRWWFEPIPDG